MIKMSVSKLTADTFYMTKYERHEVFCKHHLVELWNNQMRKGVLLFPFEREIH